MSWTLGELPKATPALCMDYLNELKSLRTLVESVTGGKFRGWNLKRYVWRQVNLPAFFLGNVSPRCQAAGIKRQPGLTSKLYRQAAQTKAVARQIQPGTDLATAGTLYTAPAFPFNWPCGHVDLQSLQWLTKCTMSKCVSLGSVKVAI